MSEPAGERKRWNVGVTKIAHADRDLAREVLGDTGAARGFADILGADTPDDDRTFPLGADCAYTVDLTDAEADAFRAASNCRYVTPEDDLDTPQVPSNVPTSTSRAWLRQNTFDGHEDWHGRNINVAILDSGTTPALRSYMGYTLVARSWGHTTAPPAGTTFADHNHGSLVASAAIPAGGRLLDFNIVTEEAETSSPARQASGIRWACDNGAKVINTSYGGPNTNNRYAPVRDALNYMAGFDTVYFASAGNDSSSTISYPGAFAFSFTHAHCVMSFEEATGRLAASSNYTTNRAAGVAPGEPIRGVNRDGVEVNWRGTSAASPFAASCAVKMLTKGNYTAKQVSAALKSRFRNLGLTYQGGGGYDMQNALDGLGAFDLELAAAGGWMGIW